MSSGLTDRGAGAAGFRLGWWYALVFSASAVALVGVTYLLLAMSLRQYDREIIQTTLVQFATAYARGGVDALTREIQRVQSSGAAGPRVSEPSRVSARLRPFGTSVFAEMTALADSMRAVGRRMGEPYLSIPSPAEVAVRHGLDTLSYVRTTRPTPSD